jgi:hypothetical protein
VLALVQPGTDARVTYTVSCENAAAFYFGWPLPALRLLLLGAALIARDLQQHRACWVKGCPPTTKTCRKIESV